MHADLVELGWTEEQWNRLCTTVTEEAQRARVAAQMLPVSGPEEPKTVAVPPFALSTDPNPYPYPTGAVVPRLTIDSDPTLFLTTIAVNVQLRTHEAADPDLNAALVMFRRAANYIARIEDALVFSGRPFANADPPFIGGRIPKVYTVTGNSSVGGIFLPAAGQTPLPGSVPAPAFTPVPPATSRGNMVVNAVVRAIDQLEANAQLGPFACALSHDLFEDICTPTANLVLPRDRILPFLQGPLLRSSAIPPANGVVVALGGTPLELIVACDVQVRFLQTTLEPRYVFRVVERVALRIKEAGSIALLSS
jgi:uncharacterized linocin/CFP29 family protein